MTASVSTQRAKLRLVLEKMRPLVHVLAALPMLWYVWLTLTDQGRLGADPAKHLLHESGQWSLYILLAMLAVTPLRLITQQPILIQYRRPLGLWAAWYALLHLVLYATAYMALDIPRIIEDVINHPYVLVGLAAGLLFIPLALTSTRASQRRLGQRWAQLHKLVYLIGILALWHFTWLKKTGLEATWLYVAIFAGLMIFRIPAVRQRLAKRT